MLTRVLPAVLPFALLAVLLATPSCASQPSTTDTITVTRVIDGDTIEVRLAGSTETVRLLGIDTPETKHPTKPVECYGHEASEHLASLLPRGTAVRLARDAEPRDQYGRLLDYVYRDDDGLFVNQAMVDGGFAAVLIIPPNGALAGPLRSAEAAARRDQRGLWGQCGGPDTPAG
jgi:micrococcal nuclease